MFSFGVVCFFFKRKTAYEMRISDWSSDVCSSDLFACERDRLLLRSLARRHRDDREFILADEDIERFGHPSPKGGLAESVDRLDMTTKTLERLLQAIAGQVDRSLAIVADRRPAQHQGSRSAIGKLIAAFGGDRGRAIALADIAEAGFGDRLSEDRRHRRLVDHGAGVGGIPVARRCRPALRCDRRRLTRAVALVRRFAATSCKRRRDRKSTRLNYSH